MAETCAPATLSYELGCLSDRLWANKVRQGFNTTDFALEIAFLHAEVSEIFEAWRRGEPVGPEAADALLFLLSVARMAGVDLGAEAVAKMAVNEARQYEQRPNGLHVQKETASD